MRESHIFVSYRRDDTAPYALALRREFERCLLSSQIFVDTQRIEAATQWPVVIMEALKRSRFVAVLIGPNWLAPNPETNSPRLFDPEDWVFKEVKFSLEQKSRAVVPILVGGAHFPSAHDLPKELTSLTEIQAFSIDTRDWSNDVERLCRSIANQFGLRLRQDEFEYPRHDEFKKKTPAVSDDRLTQALAEREMEGWEVEGSDDPNNPTRTWLVKKFKFKSFSHAMKFMNAIAEYCTSLDHHPRWENVFDEIKVWLSTWDAGHKVTEMDLTLAVHMNRVAQKIGTKIS